MIQLGSVGYDFILNLSGFQMSAARIGQELNVIDTRVQKSLDGMGTRAIQAGARAQNVFKQVTSANNAAWLAYNKAQQSATEATQKRMKAEVAANNTAQKSLARIASEQERYNNALERERLAIKSVDVAYQKHTATAITGLERINKAQGAAAQSAAALQHEIADQQRKINEGVERLADRIDLRLRRHLHDLNQFSNNALMAGGAMLTPLGFAVKGYADLDQKMRHVNVLQKEGAAGFEKLTQSVMKLGEEVGMVPTELAAALREIESTAFKGRDAFQVLTISAETARGGFVDVKDATSSLLSIMASYHLGADKAARVSDILFKVVKDGRIEFDQMRQPLSQTAAIAAKAGVSIEDLGAAFAQLTYNGRTASQAGIGVANFLTKTISPAQKAKDTAKELGLAWFASGQGADHIKKVGLSATLEEIAKATHGNINALHALYPDQRAFISALILMTKGGQEFDKFYSSALDSVGSRQQALNEEMKGAAAQFDVVKVKAINLARDAGKALFPFLSGQLDRVKGLIDGWNKLDVAYRDGIVRTYALVGVGLVLFGVLGKLISGLYSAYNGWRAFGKAAKATFEMLDTGTVRVTTLKGAFTALGVAAAGAFIGWNIGRALDELTPLGKWLDDTLYKMFRIKNLKDELTYGGRSKADDYQAMAVTAQRFASMGNINAQALGFETGKLPANIQAGIVQFGSRLGFGNGPTYSPSQYAAITQAAQKYRRNALNADHTPKTGPLESTVVAGGTDPLAGREDSVPGTARAGAVPLWMKYMNADVTKNIGKECGAAITEYLGRVGVHKSASALAQQAYKDEKYRVSAIGRDAKGAPIFPNGTIIFIPGKSGYGNIGHDNGEHFAASFYDRKKNLSMLLESTSAGHKGSWSIRNDRTFARAVGDRDYMAFGTKLPPEEAGYRREQATEARRAAAERRRALREAEAERKRSAVEARRTYFEGLSAQTATLYSGADEAAASGDPYGAAVKKTQAKKFEAQAKVLRHLYDHSSWTWMTDGMVNVLQEFVQAVDTADAQGAKLLDVAAKKTGLHFKDTFLTAIDQIGAALADSGAGEQEQLQGRITMGRGIMNLPTFGDLPKEVQDKIAGVVRNDQDKLLAATQEKNYSDLQEQLATMTENMDANGKSQEDQWAAINQKVDELLGKDAGLPEGQRSYSPNVTSRLRRESSLRTTRINRARVSGVLSDAEAARSTMESDMETAGKTRSDILVAIRDHIAKEIDTLADDVAVTDDQRADLMVKLAKADAAIATHEKELADYRAKRLRDMATERMSPEMRERYGKADDIQDKAAEDYKKDKEANVPGADAEYNRLLKQADRLRHLSVWQDVADTAKAKFVTIQDSFADAVGNMVANGGKLKDWWKSTWHDMEKEVVSVVIKNILVSFLKMVGLIKSPQTGLAGALGGVLGAAPGAGQGNPALAAAQLAGIGGTPPFVGNTGGFLSKLGLGGGVTSLLLPLLLGGGLGGIFKGLLGGGLFKGITKGVGGIFKGVKKLFHFDDPVNDFNAAHSGRDFTRQWMAGINQGMAKATVSAMSRGGGFADMLAERSALSTYGNGRTGMVKPGGDTIVHESHVHSPIILDRNNQRQLNDLLQRTDAEQQLLRVRRGSYSGRDRKY